ncbi:hypothetical protein [Streptomyces sp. NPDC012510]|uniref:hypothetical protein n=1 Tax=Streptomyces sp. NPDC012510 TaxID=3364838 RepID=UPI0036EC7159
MTDHYPYRIETATGDLTLLWRAGEGDAHDAFLVDGVGRLLVFPDLDRLQGHCEHHGRTLVRADAVPLDLDAVRGWVERPRCDSVSAGTLLDAWNFFDDLAHGLGAESALPPQGPVHDSAYEKVFGGEVLAGDVGDGAWSEEERAAVGGFLRAGLRLWDQAVRESLATPGEE